MSRNLLLSEYKRELSRAAALYGAVDGANIDDHGICARFVGAVSRVSFTLDLQMSPRNGSIPHVRTGSSSTLPSDPAMVLVHLDDTRATLMRALSALSVLDGYVVWSDDAPCDMCGGRGKSGGRDCDQCDGKGKRSEVPS